MRVADRLEARFDAAFTAELALREKQIQQCYRPVIGVHKWFARRPGTVFRALMLAEFAGDTPLRESFFRPHALAGLIADPFMGGGTPIFEANRLGFDVIGCDINPMACWIVRRSLAALDRDAFAQEAARVVSDVDREVGALYTTACRSCGGSAEVKYFLWVKTARCPSCGEANDLFPGYRLAEAERHPRHVLACADCGALNEFEVPPRSVRPARCTACQGRVQLEGNVARKKVACRRCRARFPIAADRTKPPEHRMWALEYRCTACYGRTPGRMFKAPDPADLQRFKRAHALLAEHAPPLPEDTIPAGDETDRLHRWGYRRYREMFNARQLLGLGLLLARIRDVKDAELRHALLTVFSDTLRYQNMLCRYDTYALKCQDIFSVHGYPVGLVQCENNLLGIPGAGSGSFRHFVEKYLRAKEYCAAPFETRRRRGRKEVVPLEGESIEAELVSQPPRGRKGKGRKRALLFHGPAQKAPLPAESLDAVFTDPPYFDNVQYAELIDFCYAWLRLALAAEDEAFQGASTRSSEELTGNATLGRGLEHFTAGLSAIFTRCARALKPGAPFVFTYHHNDARAYLPLVVAVLDAGLECTATLPVAGEMSASLHIAGTGSSVLDSVFVCRKPRARARAGKAHDPALALAADVEAMRRGGVRVSPGDERCLLAGHLARATIAVLCRGWDAKRSVADRLAAAGTALETLLAKDRAVPHRRRA